MKTVKVNHVILTLAFSPAALAAGAGLDRDTVDKMVNDRLAEGYDEVQITPLKSNFSDNVALESVVNLYVFRKIEDTPTTKSK